MDKEIERFSNDAGLIYEASLDPDRWPFALEALCETLGADKAQMLYIDPVDFTFSFACGFGFDPYAHNIGAGRFRRYLAQDPVAQYGITHLDEVFSDRRVIDTKKLHESPMHREIRSPVDMEFMLTVFMTDHSVDWTGICFFRGASASAFSDKDEEKLKLYLPHIKRAAHIQKVVAGASQIKTLQSAVLDHLDTGLIVVNEAHEVTACNEKAKTLMKKSKISIRGKSIVCHDYKENSLLHDAIDRALEIEQNPEEMRRIAVRLKGHGSSNPLLAVTTKLQISRFEENKQNLPIMKAHYTAKIPNRKNVLISLCDPKDHKNSWTGMLEKLFGLTPAEAALANLLADDFTLHDAAVALGRTVGTARIQLQSIFEKTDTNRQTSLIRLLMAIP